MATKGARSIVARSSRYPCETLNFNRICCAAFVNTAPLPFDFPKRDLRTVQETRFPDANSMQRSCPAARPRCMSGAVVANSLARAPCCEGRFYLESKSRVRSQASNQRHVLFPAVCRHFQKYETRRSRVAAYKLTRLSEQQEYHHVSVFLHRFRFYKHLVLSASRVSNSTSEPPEAPQYHRLLETPRSINQSCTHAMFAVTRARLGQAFVNERARNRCAQLASG